MEICVPCVDTPSLGSNGGTSCWLPEQDVSPDEGACCVVLLLQLSIELLDTKLHHHVVELTLRELASHLFHCLEEGAQGGTLAWPKGRPESEKRPETIRRFHHH